MVICSIVSYEKAWKIISEGKFSFCNQNIADLTFYNGQSEFRLKGFDTCIFKPLSKMCKTPLDIHHKQYNY